MVVQTECPFARTEPGAPTMPSAFTASRKPDTSAVAEGVATVDTHSSANATNNFMRQAAERRS
jgi:hypothetical protein